MDGSSEKMMIPQGVKSASRQVPSQLIEDGLILRENFVSETEEFELLNFIDSMPWETRLSRRTQHYGYRFDYGTKSCVRTECPIPSLFIDIIIARLGWKEIDHDRLQCTVNEYYAGQGIAPHVDTHEAFAGIIVALSLGDGIALRLKSLLQQEPATMHVIWLEQRSLISYEDKVRYAYTHGIVSRKGDLVDDRWRPRARRVSLTFRHLLKDGEQCQCKFAQLCDARGAPKFLPTRLKN